jgi:histone H3/H4
VTTLPSATCSGTLTKEKLKHSLVRVTTGDLTEKQQIREAKYPSLAEYISNIPSNPNPSPGFCSTKLGNLMLQEVHKVKRINSLCLPQLAFKAFCKHLINNHSLLIVTSVFREYRSYAGKYFPIRASARYLLQLSTERHLKNIVQEALLCAFHDNRKHVTARDIQLVRTIRNNR